MHFNIHCSTIYHSQDFEATQMPIYKGMNKEDVAGMYARIYVCVCVYIYMKYYSAKNKNEILPFAATWMDLEIVIQSEVSQTEKDKYHIISLMCGI